MSRRIGSRTRSMNTASRSKMSTAGSVTSPWTRSGRPICGHVLEHAADACEVLHARMRVGGGPRGVELHRRDEPDLGRGAEVAGVGLLGEVERHQRAELRARRAAARMRSRYSAASARDHGRHEVRHDDGAGEVARGFGQDRLQHVAVAEVDVPVVGTADGEGVGHGLRISASPSSTPAARRAAFLSMCGAGGAEIPAATPAPHCGAARRG